MITINNWEQVPEFQNEVEERAFWTTHILSDELINTFSDERPSHLPTPRKRTMYSSVNLPIEVDTLNRLKIIAKHKDINYKVLIKSFLAERLYEEEKRLHLL